MKISNLLVSVSLTLGFATSGLAQSAGGGGDVPQPSPQPPRPVIGVLYGSGSNAGGEVTQSSTPIFDALGLAQASGEEIKRICKLVPKMKKFSLNYVPYINGAPIAFSVKVAAGNCNAQSRK